MPEFAVLASIENSLNFVPSEWEQYGERLYPADAVVDAYIMGKKAGHQEYKNELVKSQATALINNLTAALKYSGSIYEELRDALKIKMISMHARVCGIFDIEILFVVDKKDFVSEKMDVAYNYLRKKKVEVEGSYNFSYIVMSGSNEEIDTDAILSDGFVLEYAPSQGN